MTPQPPSPAPAPRPWSQHWAWLLTAAVFAVLAARMFLFIDRYAVNILFWDQWDFYGPLFQGSGVWQMFDWQHGPHRQGIGFLLTATLAHFSGWNSRWDAFGVGAVLVAACLAGIVLARKCGVRGWALAIIPLLFFNLRQYEMFVNASNISHGAMPILLFMLLLLAWFIPKPGLRFSAVSLLTFLCIFTGFGIFIGVVVPVVLAILAIQYWREKRYRDLALTICALVVIAGSWTLFAAGYQFNPAVDGYRFPYEKPQEYLYFVAAMFDNFHGLKTDNFFALLAGMAFTAVLLALMLIRGWRLLRNRRETQQVDIIVFSLCAFVLVYCANTAVGRVFLGWRDAASASRYVTLLIPAGLALLVSVGSGDRSRVRSGLLAFYLAFLAYNTVQLHSRDWRVVDHFSRGRADWKTVFLETNSQETADARTHFQVYPIPVSDEKIQFLREHHLNLFRQDSRP